MHILAILLSLIGSEQGTAVTGNPVRELTDEHRIKLVVNTLERALQDKEEALVLACLSDRVSNRDTKELQTSFSKYVANVQVPEDKPLVYLRTFEVKVDGNKATAKVEAFTYGNDNRIQAVHIIPFVKGERSWSIDDARPVNALLKQIGGIVPLKQLETPEEKDGRTAPIEAIEKGIKSAVSTIKALRAETTSEETNEIENSPSETNPNTEATQ